MNPITYMEATCDECGDEITNHDSDIEFAFLRNGHLVCETCGHEKADHVLRWFTVDQETQPTPEEIKEALQKLDDTEEPEA